MSLSVSTQPDTPTLADGDPLAGDDDSPHEPEELAYRRHIAPLDRRAFITALFVTGPLYFLFVVSDYFELGWSPTFWFSLGLHLLVLLFCLGLGAWLGRHEVSLQQLHRLSLLFFVVVASNVMIVFPVSRREFQEIYPGVLMMVLAAFFLVPSILRHRIAISVFLLLAMAIEAPVWYQPDGEELPIAAILFAVAMIFGVMASRQQEYLRREAFSDAERSRRLSGRLSQEVALRRHLEAEAKHLAYTDELTGLPNRRHFFEQARQELQRSKPRQRLATARSTSSPTA